MTQKSGSSRSILETVLTFFALFLVVHFGLQYFFPEKFGNETAPKEPIVISAQDATVRMGHHPIFVIENNTDQELQLQDQCPLPPVNVSFVTQTPNGETFVDVIPNDTALPCSYPSVIPPQSSITLDMGPWKYSIFEQLGTYEITFPVYSGRPNPTVRIQMQDVGFITQTFRAFVTKPLLNALILIAGVLPNHNLGWAIIILTFAIKLLLLVPNQHALEGQKKITELQPKIDALKQKYKDDPKRQQEETLKLWKKERINPMQSCLPMLIQFPILIGLFFTIRDGSILELSRHLIYDFNSHLSWSFGTSFFGMDLTKPNLYVMPPFLVIAQFIQMKLSFARRKKKDDTIDVGKKKFTFDQQTIMLYGLPIMIGVFALRFAAAVSLYWGASTVFGIGQQWFVNRKKVTS